MKLKTRLVFFFALPLLLAAAALIWQMGKPEAVAAAAFVTPRYEVPVLMYHAFTDNEALVESSAFYVTPGRFEQQITDMLRHGYTPVFASELANPTALPKKPIVITMDDGYLDNYELAFPILKKHNVKATIFVISSYIDGDDGDDYITWDNAREMTDSGLVDIQSHTFDMHNPDGIGLTDGADRSEWLSALTQDADSADAVFTRELGYTPTVLCCPFGKGNEVENAYGGRYAVIFGGEYGVANLEINSPLSLPRIIANEKTEIRARF